MSCASDKLMELKNDQNGQCHSRVLNASPRTEPGAARPRKAKRRPSNTRTERARTPTVSALLSASLAHFSDTSGITCTYHLLAAQLLAEKADDLREPLASLHLRRNELARRSQGSLRQRCWTKGSCLQATTAHLDLGLLQNRGVTDRPEQNDDCRSPRTRVSSLRGDQPLVLWPHAMNRQKAHKRQGLSTFGGRRLFRRCHSRPVPCSGCTAARVSTPPASL